MRLVFSIVTSIDPDILILDEWIGTGDRDFMAKAKNRLVDMTRSAKITLLASHSTALLKSVCNRGIVLDEGRILVDDTMESAIDKYTATNPKN